MKRKHKKWQGICMYTKIADVDMKNKAVLGLHPFKDCLDNMKECPEECLKDYNCIIGKLIFALTKHGVKI
jgi:hypothetical protein